MKVLFHLGHPAHFHLFKNTIRDLIRKDHKVKILIKKKDILESLLINEGFEYENILPGGRKATKFHIALGLLKQDIGVINFARKFKPDLLVGTSVPIAHAGKLLNIPSIDVNEDDADVVPFHSKLAYPFISHVISPSSCNNGKWETKSIKYEGYHELAYLHPKVFKPDINICKKYLDTERDFFVLRFSGLDAHHDKGISGIDDEKAKQLIEILKPYGNVFITSERLLSEDLERYRKKINPLDIHHILAFAKIYIGDSQTMAAEAGVLGTPFIRFNDFVGKIGYLNELENNYLLGFGIRPKDKELLFQKVEELLDLEDIEALFTKRRHKMLSEKINLATFLTWFIENYPHSIKTINENPNYQFNFK